MINFFKDENKNIAVALNGTIGGLKEIKAGETDAAIEKHVPSVTVEGNKVTVKVGEVTHPMTEAHYIEWVAVETDKGLSVKYLNPNEEPVAEFLLNENEKVLKTYAYCNLHGLWSK